MGTRARIVVIAQETGQSQVVAPVLARLAARSELDLHVWGHRHSSAVWREAGLAFREARDGLPLPLTVADADAYLAGTRPSLVVTGASSPLNQARDHTTLNMGVAARARGIPTATFLDHWQGLDRFFAAPDDRRPLYAPDLLGVPDGATRDRLAAELPSCVVATGHPHMEKLWRAACDREPGSRRTALGLAEDDRVLVLVSQIVEETQPGRPRASLLDMMVGGTDYLSAVAALTKARGWRFCAKAHPSDHQATRDRARAISDPVLADLDAADVLEVADALIGWDSMLLIQGALLGLPALSLQAADRPLEALDLGAMGLCDRADSLGAAGAWLEMACRRRDPRDLPPALHELVTDAAARSEAALLCLLENSMGDR